MWVSCTRSASWRAHCAAQDFFSKECWAHHPKPYAEFMEWRKSEDERWEAEKSRLVPGM